MFRSRHLACAVSLLIFLATLYQYRAVYAPYRRLCRFGYESLELACSLASGKGFADPFTPLATGPSAHIAPAFPFLAAQVIRIYGDGPTGAVALQWVAAVALALQLSFFPWLTRKWGLGILPGVLATFPWIFLGITLLPMWEAVYATLFTLLLAWVMHDILSGQCSTFRIVVTGVLWGIHFLINPVSLFVLFACLIWVFRAVTISVKKKVLLLAIPFLIVSPWLIRNYRVFDHVVFIRDNFGLELAISNNPCARFWFKANQFSHCYAHPNESAEEAEKVRAMGEYEYNQALQKEALSWIRSNPGRFATLTTQRLIAFWLPTPTGNPFHDQHVPWDMLIVWLLTLLSVPGLFLLFKKNATAAITCLLWLVFFPPVYYVIQFDGRYRYPILWATFIPACFFLIEMSRGVWRAFRGD